MSSANKGGPIHGKFQFARRDNGHGCSDWVIGVPAALVVAR